MTEQHYSTATRREYIRSQLGKYDLEAKSGYSLRDIAIDVHRAFKREGNPPSPATIKNDLAILADEKGRTISDEDLERLAPENFPTWRGDFFMAPNGKPYETPTHQFAWFWLAASLALRIPLPQWVVDWYADHGTEIAINDWVERPERLMTVWILAPPRHGKTDLFEHLCVWLICQNPNIRILWNGRTEKMAKRTVSHVKRYLESDAKLIEAYGPWETMGNWADEAFIVATRTINLRAATMQALGKNADVLSLDADLIVSDDPVNLKDSESPTIVDKDTRWMKTQLMTRRETWTPFLGIGSHQPSPTGDMYSELEAGVERVDEDDDMPVGLQIIRIKGHDYEKCRDGDTEAERHGEWCLLWPSIRPLWFHKSQKSDLGDVLYEVCYNQDSREGNIDYFQPMVIRGAYPAPVMDFEKGQYLPHDLTLKKAGILDRTRSFGDVPSCCGRKNMLLVAVGFDPASGESRHAAEAALAVVGICRYCTRRYLIDIWHKRGSSEEHPGVIGLHAKLYRPLRVRIEINAYQKSLARNKELKEFASALKFHIDEWETDERRDTPSLGVPFLATEMNAGMFSVPYATQADREKVESLLKQFLQWPKKPNDQVIAVWLGSLSLEQLLAESLNTGGEQMGDPDDIPDYLLDEIIEVHIGEALRAE